MQHTKVCKVQNYAISKIMQGSNGVREQYVQVSFGETSGSRNVEYWGSSGQCFGPTSFYSLHE